MHSITVDCRGLVPLKQKVNFDLKKRKKVSFVFRFTGSLSVYTEHRSFKRTLLPLGGTYWTDTTQIDLKHLFLLFESLCTNRL